MCRRALAIFLAFTMLLTMLISLNSADVKTEIFFFYGGLLGAFSAVMTVYLSIN